MRTEMKVIAGFALFLTSTIAQAASVVPLWDCRTESQDQDFQIRAQVGEVIRSVPRSFQLVITDLGRNSPTFRKKFGPYLLSEKKASPMTGVAVLEGESVSFLLGTGQDRDHLFGQVVGEWNGGSIQVTLVCRALEIDLGVE